MWTLEEFILCYDFAESEMRMWQKRETALQTECVYVCVCACAAAAAGQIFESPHSK